MIEEVTVFWPNYHNDSRHQPERLARFVLVGEDAVQVTIGERTVTWPHERAMRVLKTFIDARYVVRKDVLLTRQPAEVR